MQLTRRSLEVGGARRVATAAACAVLALATCTSALALRMEVADSSSQSPETKKMDPKAAAGNLITKVPPVYPVDAKKAGIAGKVLLDAVIGKDGSVEQLRVVSGPAELQQSALDAVKQWKYKPFLLNGDPIEVKTNITIVYTLAK